MRILSGNANRPLAEAISHYLDVRLTQAEVRRFNDKEIYVEIQENVRGEASIKTPRRIYIPNLPAPDRLARSTTMNPM